MKNLIVSLGVILVMLIGGFFALNAYIYNEEQGDGGPTETPFVSASATPAASPTSEGLEGEADPSRMKLTMKTWIWQSALYNDGREIVPKKKGAFTIAFGEDKRFSATTDCNTVAGTYTVNQYELLFSDIVSTKMYCEGSQEKDFITLLSNTAGHLFTARGNLIFDLKFDSGTVTFN